MTTTATVEELRLDDNHRYWLGTKNIPGVNEVLQGVGIIDPSWYEPEHAYRGQYVHAATHYIDEGDYDMDSCLPEFRGYLDAWLRAKRETGMDIIDIEQMRWHRTYQFAGRRDRKINWVGREWIADIKTVGTPGAPGPKWAGEALAAYDMMDPREDRYARGRVSILLYPDGTWRPELWEDFSDRTHWLNYLATFRRLKFHGRIK